MEHQLYNAIYITMVEDRKFLQIVPGNYVSLCMVHNGGNWISDSLDAPINTRIW